CIAAGIGVGEEDGSAVGGSVKVAARVVYRLQKEHAFEFGRVAIEFGSADERYRGCGPHDDVFQFPSLDVDERMTAKDTITAPELRGDAPRPVPHSAEFKTFRLRRLQFSRSRYPLK